ncbi:HNH endonuclease [Flexivirga caeni]|uniref:HNH endonuclease n=2 Tax=Flexivirga caeni TaxID=2294115 RepID=A0A3M9M257_9MICO|nr:HNH endonuclease [Flexivirga caeni]
MADTLTGRVTGRAVTGPVDVHVDLLIPIDTLLAEEPGQVAGFGPVPADLAREWATSDEVQVRRLFTYPETGDLIGMESRSRCYRGGLARLVRVRDRTCRTPWCDAPVKQTDHITSYARGGPTSERDGQGLCERCNYVKEHPDYLVGGDAGQTHVVTGGLSASSRPPAPPGHPPPTRSPIRRTLMNIEWQHALRHH